ncbi:MAG: helix-turn-helix domain-containing protein [Chloroflexota bacterium]
MSEQLVSIAQAAGMLRVSRSQIYVLIKRGQLGPVPLSPVYLKGGPVGIPLAQVLSLLPEEEREAAMSRLRK